MTQQGILVSLMLIAVICSGLVGFWIGHGFQKEEDAATQLENIHARGMIESTSIELRKANKLNLELQAALHHRKIIEEAINARPQANQSSAPLHDQTDQARQEGNKAKPDSSTAVEAGSLSRPRNNAPPPRNTSSNEATKL
jgi:hypothetical protein